MLNLGSLLLHFPEMDAPVSAKVALLEALVAGPGYGLDLIERVTTRTGGKMVLGQGSVYPALRELEREGLISSYQSNESLSDRGGRPRKYYKLNTKGAKAVMEHHKVVLGLFGIFGLPDEVT